MTEIAAPAAPRAELPRDLEVLSAPPGPGLTRIVLDANGQRATVTEVLAWEDSSTSASVGTTYGEARSHGERTRPICITPCEFDFQPGLHVLDFQVEGKGSDRIRVQVGGTRKLVRVALGRTVAPGTPSMAGLTLQIAGLATAIVGAAVWAGYSAGHPDVDRDKRRDTGVALTVGGGAGFLLGVPLSYSAPGTHQGSAITEVTLSTP